MNTETTEIAARTEERLSDFVKSSEDLETRITDAICNLLILAQERDVNIGTVLTRGAGHFAASYIEPLTGEDAEQWLSDELFPLTGEREFAEYVADEAIVLSGKKGSIDAPEWGV